MEITFDNHELREICRSQDRAEALLSNAAAKRLRTLVANMRAAATAGELMLVTATEPSGKGFVVSLSATETVKVEVAHLSIPTKDSCTDWASVYRVKIITIGGGDG